MRNLPKDEREVFDRLPLGDSEEVLQNWHTIRKFINESTLIKNYPMASKSAIVALREGKCTP